MPDGLLGFATSVVTPEIVPPAAGDVHETAGGARSTVALRVVVLGPLFAVSVTESVPVYTPEPTGTSEVFVPSHSICSVPVLALPVSVLTKLLPVSLIVSVYV